MSDPIGNILDSQTYALWQQYLAFETQGLRRQALRRLEDFIRALRQVAPERREEFLEQFCRLVIDEKQELPLRYPLFAELLAPYLIAKYHDRSPAAPRWIAAFTHWLNSTSKYREELGLGYISELLMLREAMARDPSNLIVQLRIVEIMARQFNYSIHEVPFGVLYGLNGANIAQCQELLGALAEFRQLAQNTGQLRDYEQRLREWEFYFKAYADYLAKYRQYNGFADYLQRQTHA